MLFLFQKLDSLWNDSLHRNAFYLMASTGIMAILGFFYWLIVAKLYSPEQVGLATAAFSLATLLSNLGTFGLRTGITHYLPQSKQKNRLINTVFTLSILICLSITAVCFLLLPYVSPKLLLIRSSLLFLASFTAFVVLNGLGNIFEGIFSALRVAEFVLIKNTVLSSFKILCVLFLTTFGALGIFLSWQIALGLAALISFLLLAKKFGCRFIPIVDISLTKEIASFSFLNHISTFLSSLPALALPIVITNILHERDAAYFYMDMMIANMLYIIPLAASQSLFVEGSYDRSAIVSNLKKTVQSIALFLTPAIAVLLLFGKYILLVFGKDYTVTGNALLTLFCIAAIPVSIYYICQAILTIHHKLYQLILVNSVNAGLILFLAYQFSGQGLVGMGYAWIVGYTLSALLSVLFAWRDIFGR